MRFAAVSALVALCFMWSMAYAEEGGLPEGYPFTSIQQPAGKDGVPPTSAPVQVPGPQQSQGQGQQRGQIPPAQAVQPSLPKNSPLDLPLPQSFGSGVTGNPNIPSSGGGIGGGPAVKPQKVKQPPVNFSLGIEKDIPVTGRALPPVGKLPDGVRTVDPTVVYVSDGVVYEVKVSRWMPNRFATPFRAPKVVDSSGAQIQTVNGDVFILPSGDGPFIVYILEGTPTPGVKSPTISLLMTPVESLPAQNVIVMYENGPAGGGTAATLGSKESPYTVSIKKVFRSVVRGEVPDGFSRAKFDSKKIAKAVMGGVLELTPHEYFSGPGRMIVVYRVRNVGEGAAEINEESFYRERVLAVAAFPDLVVMPGQETMLYVLVETSQE